MMTGPAPAGPAAPASAAGPGPTAAGPGPTAGTAEPVPTLLVEVLRGSPTAEEIAALTAVVSSLAAAGRATAARSGKRGGRGWADRSRLLRAPLWPGPDGWRSSARPR